MADYDFTKFLYAYAEAAIWADAPDGEKWTPYMLADITLQRFRDDCHKFVDANRALLDRSGLSAESAGHDFWLTRNGHGSGFWDSDLPGNTGEALTAASHTFEECTLYLRDDGKIYIG